MTCVRLSVMVLASAIAVPAAAHETARSPLAGTSWQLVKFTGGNDSTLTPPDPSRYTIEFGANGKVSARVDCNRGSGTWKTDGKASLEFGPMALTRAMCPPGSLHDQIVKQWGNIRSYVLKDGHLFLSLMADGGIYEYAPLGAAGPKSP
jgi:para-nitrobenzyl esterase